jgi:hypothetical protein
MTARITRKPRTVVTTEDAFGTPAAARSSMMNVAGKTDDELEPGEELLVDDSELVEDDPNTMKGPVYPEGKQIQISLGNLKRLVRARLC